MTEGQLRLNYPRVKSIQGMVLAGGSVRVRPTLPWHGFERADFVTDPLRDGRRRTYQLDLMPTSWVFQAGHRIRLSLAGADAPSFAPHPALDAARPQTWTVHRGPGLSQLVLPVIPSGPRGKPIEGR